MALSKKTQEGLAGAMTQLSRRQETNVFKQPVITGESTGTLLPVAGKDRAEKLSALEERMNLWTKSVVHNYTKIILALDQIDREGLYKLRGTDSIRDYIKQFGIAEKINMGIASIYDRINIARYAAKHNLDYASEVQEIGESKFRYLIRGGLDLGKDISLEDLKSKNTSQLQKMIYPNAKPKKKTGGGTVREMAAKADEILVDKALKQITFKMDEAEFRRWAVEVKKSGRVKVI